MAGFELYIALLVGALLGVGLSWWARRAYMRGVQDRDSQYLQLTRALSGTPSPEDLYEAIGDFSSSHDIVFDIDVVTFFASGVYARQWPGLVQHMLSAVKNFVKDCPQEHNTVIVRAIKLTADREPSYSFESLFNPSVEQSGEE